MAVSLLLLPTRFKWRALRFRIIRGWWQVCVAPGIGLWCVGRPRIRVAARNLCDDRGVARALFAVHGILLMAAAIGWHVRISWEAGLASLAFALPNQSNRAVALCACRTGAWPLRAAGRFTFRREGVRVLTVAP